jgi:phytoene desaturase
MAKVIVIGAGIGGMSAAARLAKAGHDVTVFEGSDRTGGKCRTKWIGNYAFDTGPSLLTLPAVYRDLFLKTGKRIEHVLEIEPVDPAFEYNFADKTKLTFPNLSLKGICDSIESVLGKAAGDQWHNLMQRAEHMWDVSRGPFVESELKSIRSLIAKKGFLKDLRVIAPYLSLRNLTSKYTTNPYLSKIVDRYATYSGSDPRKVPAVLLTIAFVESSFGAWHIKGGIGQLAVALETRCRELGVKFELKSPVTRIIHDSRKATGVIVGNQTHAADFIVANADAEIVYNKLLSADLKVVKPERVKLVESTKSLAGFSLLLGLNNSKLSGPAPKMPHHSIYFPENYDAEFDDIFKKKIPVNDPTIYICAPNDSKMVKGENLEAWSILINAPRHEPGSGWDWNKGCADYAAKIITKLDELGLRVSERLEIMQFETPADLENSVSAPGGSIYGTSSNGARSAFLRARNTSPLVNLYCVGGSAHPGGGLPLVGISAEIVADAIAKASS